MSELQLTAPSVSVVIPTRGRPELLQLAVESVLGQRYAGDVECIVVYDRSKPDIESHSLGPNRRVTVITNTRTPGAAGARNSAVVSAKGDLIAFCDDDDVWLPTKLDVQTAALLAAPDAIAAGSGYIGDTDGRLIVRMPPGTELSSRDLLRSRVADLHPSTLVAWRGRVAEQVGLIDENVPGSYGEDYDWLLRMASRARILTVPQPLVRVLWHGGSYFDGDFEVIIQAIRYLLQKHPEFATEPVGLARLYGRLAFAHAALGARAEAARLALRAARLNPRERRAYVALAVSAGVLRASTVSQMATAAGRRL